MGRARAEQETTSRLPVRFGAGVFRKHHASAKEQHPSHPRSSEAALEICGNGKRCQGVTGQHGCLFSFDPGVYDRMRFPYIPACHSWRGTKKTYVRQQARPGTSSKETPDDTGAKGTPDSQMADALSFGKRAKQLLQVHFVLVIMFGTRPEPVVCLSFLVSYQD